MLSDRLPEIVTAQQLAGQAGFQLKQKKPDHELLKYFPSASGHPSGCNDPAIMDEFLERFGGPGTSKRKATLGDEWSHIFSTFYIALLDACEDPEKVIVVSHEPLLGLGP